MPDFSSGFRMGQDAGEHNRQARRNTEDQDRKRFEQQRADRNTQLGVWGDELAAAIERNGGKPFAEWNKQEQTIFANRAKDLAANGAADGSHIVQLHFDKDGRSIAEVGGKRPDGSPIKKGAPMSVGGGTDDDPIVFGPDEWETILLTKLSPYSQRLNGLAATLGAQEAGKQVIGPASGAEAAPAAAPGGVPAIESPATQAPVVVTAQRGDAVPTLSTKPLPMPAQATESPGPMASGGYVAPQQSGSVAQRPSAPRAAVAPKDMSSPYMQGSLAAAQSVGLAPELAQFALNAESSGDQKRDMNNGISGARGPFQIMPDTFAAINEQFFGNALDFNNPDHVAQAGAMNLKNEMDYFKDPELALAAHFMGRGAVQRAMDGGGKEAVNAMVAPGNNGGKTVGDYLASTGIGAPVGPAQAAEAAPAGPATLETVGQKARENAGVVKNVIGSAVDFDLNHVTKVLSGGRDDGNVLAGAGNAMVELPGMAIRGLQDLANDPNRLISAAAGDPAGNVDKWISKRAEVPDNTSEALDARDTVDRAMLPHIVDKRDRALAAGDTAGAKRYQRALESSSRAIAARASVARSAKISKPVPPSERTFAAVTGPAQTLKSDVAAGGAVKTQEQLQADLAVLKNGQRQGNTKITPRQLDAASWMFATGKLTAEQFERYAKSGEINKRELENLDPYQFGLERQPDGSLAVLYTPSPELLAERYDYARRTSGGKDDDGTYGRTPDNTALFNQTVQYFDGISSGKGADKTWMGRSPFENASIINNLMRTPELGLFLMDRGYLPPDKEGKPDYGSADPAAINEILTKLTAQMKTGKEWEDRGWLTRTFNGIMGKNPPNMDPRAAFQRPEGEPGQMITLPDGRTMSTEQAVEKLRSRGIEGTDEELKQAALTLFAK